MPMVMPSRMPPTRIPSPVRAPSPTPSPVEAPAPSPIGRVVTSEIETGIPIVGAAPVTPRREIDGIDDDIPSHDGDVVEPRAVDAVHEESRVVVIVVITGRTDIVRVFEHAQPPQVGTFVSVAVTVYVAVRITVVYSLQYDAVLGVGLCQHGFDARTAGFRFGPFYFRLPAFGLRYGLPVMRPVHVVVIRGGGCGIAGSGTSGGQHGGESGQRRSQIFNHLSHSCKRYVMVPSFVMITQESVFCFVTRTAECIYIRRCGSLFCCIIICATSAGVAYPKLRKIFRRAELRRTSRKKWGVKCGPARFLSRTG